MSTHGTSPHEQAPVPATPQAATHTELPTKRTVGELVADVSQTFSALVRDEIKLAQTQLVEKFSRLGVGGGMLAAAGLLVALYAVPVLLYAAIHALALVLPVWASALIVGGVLLLVAGIIAFIGYKALQASQQQDMPDPVGGLKQSVDAVKKGFAK